MTDNALRQQMGISPKGCALYWFQTLTHGCIGSFASALCRCLVSAALLRLPSTAACAGTKHPSANEQNHLPVQIIPKIARLPGSVFT